MGYAGTVVVATVASPLRRCALHLVQRRRVLNEWVNKRVIVSS